MCQLSELVNTQLGISAGWKCILVRRWQCIPAAAAAYDTSADAASSGVAADYAASDGDAAASSDVAADYAASGAAAASDGGALRKLTQAANCLFTRLEFSLVPEGFLTAQFLQKL